MMRIVLLLLSVLASATVLAGEGMPVAPDGACERATVDPGKPPRGEAGDAARTPGPKPVLRSEIPVRAAPPPRHSFLPGMFR